ncbi:MAG TPA: metallophosphoesterase [Thermoleophilaceae bacterium]|nr:metallophosphoesterase [Thermoleophilaceae bacterium]
MASPRLRRAAATACVVLASVSAAAGTLSVFQIERELSVGAVQLSTTPAREGALDLYVPLVDWGVRFPGAVRLPARLSVDLRTVDRTAAQRLAAGDLPELAHVRDEAADAIAAYIRLLILVTAISALALGGLVALAIRGRVARLSLLLAAAGLTTLACCAAIALLLPPRGEIGDPEYYAHGPDIPAALRTVELATRSSEILSEELNSQLVGLARLIAAPARRNAGAGAPRRLTLASDLHNNLLALPTLERAVDRGPLFFAGDLTASGSPFEAALTRRIARIGSPSVFVTGNHDSDVLARRLAAAGAIVLTERGRLRGDGTYGPVVARVAGLRVAGYSDPFERRRAEGYRDRYDDGPPTTERRRRFADWLEPLVGNVDIVMVHSPGLAKLTVRELRADPPTRPLALLTGHTHRATVATSTNVLELNGGTAGGGGAGNLDENQPFGMAVLTYAAADGFRPLLADIVEIDAHSGAASAQRTPLDLRAPDGDAAAPASDSVRGAKR